MESDDLLSNPFVHFPHMVSEPGERDLRLRGVFWDSWALSFAVESFGHKGGRSCEVLVTFGGFSKLDRDFEGQNDFF